MSTPFNKRVNIDVTEHEVPSEVTVHPEMAWNDEMHAFYNVAYGLDAEVDVNEKPAQWSDTDHQSPKERTKCTMCGAGDHSATMCPSSCCLKCGEKTASFQDDCAKCVEWASEVCRICGEQGHSKNDCPDHVDSGGLRFLAPLANRNVAPILFCFCVLCYAVEQNNG